MSLHMKMSEREVTLCWALCPGLEPTTFRKLKNHFGSSLAVYEASEEEWQLVVKLRPYTLERMSDWRRKIPSLLGHVESHLARKGISYMVYGDTAYPRGLYDLFQPPMVLFMRGDTSLLSTAVVFSIVGTRRASSYGLEVTKWIASSFARAGYVICSGMAVGIDATSHMATIGMQGKTIAVLGTGVDICYPPTNQSIYQEILKSGLLVSEYAPGTGVAKYHFPERNRIIAALSKATVVIQAGDKSGAIVTAEHALELGRDVYVVPGPITSKSFRGAHRLLVDGAIPMIDPEEIIEAYGATRATTPNEHTSSVPSHLQIYIDTLIEEGPLRAGELASVCALPPSQVYAALLELEIGKLVLRTSDGRYQMARRSN